MSVGKNHYMDLLSHKAGCTRRHFWVHMNLTFQSVTIPKFWDVGRVPISGLYQTKSIQNTSSWSHYTQCLLFSVFSGAWVWPNQCTPKYANHISKRSSLAYPKTYSQGHSRSPEVENCKIGQIWILFKKAKSDGGSIILALRAQVLIYILGFYAL